MATDIKISQMPSATSLEGTELISIVLGGVNKTTTPSKIKEGLATTAQLANKVDKDGNKVLSDKNFTSEYETKLKGIAENANNYTHPTGAGNNHIPAGGSSGQILKWSAAGTAVWGNPTTYSAATDSTLGLVKQGVAVADATSAEDVVAVVNALLASLRNSGGIAPNAAAAAASISLNSLAAGGEVKEATTVSKEESTDIIDFVPPMIIEQGKRYKENNIVYECILTSKLPISNKLKDLIGYYVKVSK